MKRSEREERIAKDEGDSEDFVFVSARMVNSHNCIYHNDFGCSSFTGETDRRKMTRQRAQMRGFAPCRICILDDVTQNYVGYGGKSKLEHVLEQQKK